MYLRSLLQGIEPSHWPGTPRDKSPFLTRTLRVVFHFIVVHEYAFTEENQSPPANDLLCSFPVFPERLLF